VKLIAGSIFARDFRILAPLAEGGMGAVYSVEQLSTGKRRALKVMLPALIPDARARERFVQEARIGAQVESEHIVDVVASGIDEPTGMPWIAMELLDGQDLAAYIAQRGPMPHAEAYELIAQLCDGLGAAHKKGIVHRDLKPENIFIATTRRRGSPFTLKLLDFGIAKVALPNHTSATGTSAMGSPLWMAPEQTEAGTRLRPATDVWAVGLLAFYVVTGKSYWRSGNLAEVGLTPIFTEVLVLPLESSAMRAVELGVGHLLPHGFDAWFMRCVTRTQEQRFTDANEALRALTPQLGFVESSALRRVPQTALMQQPTSLPAHAYAQAVQPSHSVHPPHAHHSGPREVPQTYAQQLPSIPPPNYPPHPSAYPPQHATHPSAYPPQHATHPSAYPPAAYPTPPTHHAPPQAPLEDSARWIPYAIGGGLGLMIFAGVALAIAMLVLLNDRSDNVPPVPEPRALLLPDAGAEVVVDAAPPDAPILLDVREPEGARPAHVERVATVVDEPDAFTPVINTVQPSALEPFPVEGTTRFAGQWTGNGWRYRIVMTLVRDGMYVSGSIRWTLLESADELYQARIGESATEQVEGTYEGGRLLLEGQSVSDDSLIDTDSYALQLAANGMLTGSAETGGGRFLARGE